MDSTKYLFEGFRQVWSLKCRISTPLYPCLCSIYRCILLRPSNFDSWRHKILVMSIQQPIRFPEIFISLMFERFGVYFFRIILRVLWNENFTMVNCEVFVYPRVYPVNKDCMTLHDPAKPMVPHLYATTLHFKEIQKQQNNKQNIHSEKVRGELRCVHPQFPKINSWHASSLPSCVNVRCTSCSHHGGQNWHKGTRLEMWGKFVLSEISFDFWGVLYKNSIIRMWYR